MRSTITDLGLYALAASSIAEAQESPQGQHAEAHLLGDINTISRYWGAFSQPISSKTPLTLSLKARSPHTETMRQTSLA